ncbi:hypothetical protein HYE82_19550 [Streptomyces sp. BR123]|uniref:hypothetical protein n=1 Tax=Streptomyces sp. BR123 TaxID=2749828 RepID=UPI0015C41951|nr:hypothetical protein [Streptomyces sp. BR123]NXY96546.1 hypothetical protein [Streptomyces sp. BR123]
MSLNVHARRVRDPALPFGHRRSALRSTVVLYRPFGFSGTWSFLSRSGDLRRDGDALVRALEKLELSRAAALAERAEFAERRRAEKHLEHRRQPRATDIRCFLGPRWPGPDGHVAAAHEVARLWRERGRPGATPLPGPGAGAAEGADPRAEEELCAYVAAYLEAGGYLEQARLELLAEGLRRLNLRIARLSRTGRDCVALVELRRMAEVVLADPGGSSLRHAR